MLEAFAFQGMFLLWLKHNKKRFTQSQINTYPLGIQAVAIISQILAGIFIDRTGHRLPMVIFAAAMQLVTASLLLVRNLPDAGIFTAHYLSGTSFIVNPLMYGWASTILQRSGDDAVRSVILYSMAGAGLLLYTFWGIVMYPATDVPYWRKGAVTMCVVVFVFVAASFAVRWVSAAICLKMHQSADLDSSIGRRPGRKGRGKMMVLRTTRWISRSNTQLKRASTSGAYCKTVRGSCGRTLAQLSCHGRSCRRNLRKLFLRCTYQLDYLSGGMPLRGIQRQFHP
jgi:MFS family permease